MSIGITTAGDGAEIYFSDIECGEGAYKMVRQLLQKQNQYHDTHNEKAP